MGSSGERKRSSDAAAHHVTSRLHPRVYVLLIACIVWFVAAVWSFAGAGVIDYLLFIVSGFLFAAVALPLILSRVGRSEATTPRRSARPTWREWASWDFEICQGRLSGTQAALQILLPMVAAAVGMTAIGIVLHVTELGGI